MPAIKPLNPRERRFLESFLTRPDIPKGTLSYEQVQGFLFAVACAPDLVKPSEWLPLILAGDEPGFRDAEEAQRVLGALMSLFNEVLHQAQEGKPRLPEDCAFREDLMANLEKDAPVSQWCRGFLMGHDWLWDAWEERIPEGVHEEVASLLMVLTFFGSRSLAEAYVEETTSSDSSVETMGARFRELFPRAMAEYADIGVSTYRAWWRREMEAPRPAPSPPHPGRNDPCPCGSGRKYKRCCGAQTH